MSNLDGPIVLRLYLCMPPGESGADLADDRQASIRTFFRALEAQVGLAFPAPAPVIVPLSPDFGPAGSTETLVRARSCHVALLDISESNGDVFFALGVLTALNVPTLLMRKVSTLRVSAPPLSSVGRPVVLYDSLDELPVELYRQLIDLIRGSVHNPVVPPNDLNALWFNQSITELHVVNPPEHQKSEFANPDAPNYIYIDNLGDRDSLVDVLAFAHKHYPTAKIYRYSSEDFPRRFLESDLIVIGGPGVEGVEPGNSICRLMGERAGSSVRYSADGECAFFDGTEWPTEYDNANRLTRDFGYFARFRNPLNHRSSIVLIHGSHTMGVLGAARAFSDHANALPNIRRALDRFGSQPSFEAGFFVDIDEGAVMCPTVDSLKPL